MAKMFKSDDVIIVATQEDADKLVLDARNNKDGYILKDYKVKYKPKKAKGEIVDEHYLVTLTKQYCEEWE